MIKARKIDTSKIEGQKFSCQSYCAKCCFYQLPMITSSDITRIHKYLNSLKNKDYEDFLFNWLSSQNLMLKVSNDEIKQMRDGLKAFWWPVQHIELKTELIVQNYTMYMMPSSGRCRFLDPLELTCFIHDVKPLTCKLYPFITKIVNNCIDEIHVDSDSCPGIGIGPPVDVEEIVKVHKEYSEAITRDISITSEYLIKKGLLKKRKIFDIKNKPSFSEEEFAHENLAMIESYYTRKKTQKRPPKKRIVEPLVDAGLMPKHPLLELWNAQYG